MALAILLFIHRQSIVLGGIIQNGVPPAHGATDGEKAGMSRCPTAVMEDGEPASSFSRWRGGRGRYDAQCVDPLPVTAGDDGLCGGCLSNAEGWEGALRGLPSGDNRFHMRKGRSFVEMLYKRL